MKRLLTLAVILLFSFVLFACKDEAGEVKATLSNLEVGLYNMAFTITIEDPEDQITGEIGLNLYDSNDKLIKNWPVDELTNTYDVSGLNNEMTYTLKLSATFGRKLVQLLERDIELASAETVHIKTVADFKAMVNNRSGNYVLDNDIDFSAETFTTPFTSPFSGTFDGQGFTLKNINFDKIIQYTGVFGYVSSGVIKNVNFDNVTIGTVANPITMATSSRVGIVAGYLASSTGSIENVNVTNSVISYVTSSTVQAYVGGLVGESRGSVTKSSVESSTLSLKSTSYGRIRVGGAIGLLGEEAMLKEVSTDATINVEIAGASIKDRDININVGGVIGFHNARNVNRSVEHLISSANISVILDFGTVEGTTKGNYSLYAGGIAGIAYSSVNQALYSGSISVEHAKNEFEEDVNKYFFVGGLYGFYGSNKESLGNLRSSDQALIDITVSDDVILKASQTVADTSSTAVNVFSYFGDLGLMINDVDESANDTIVVVTTLDEFFDSEFIEAYLAE